MKKSVCVLLAAVPVMLIGLAFGQQPCPNCQRGVNGTATRLWVAGERPFHVTLSAGDRYINLQFSKQGLLEAAWLQPDVPKKRADVANSESKIDGSPLKNGY